MSLYRSSTPALVGLAGLSLTLFAVAEHSTRPVHASAYAKKMEAVRLVERGERMLRDAKEARGIATDPRNDPSGSGVIGPQFTPITTDRGAQAAKALAAHPNFGAAVTQMLLEAHVRRGDLVAVGMTGSLPGLNLAVYAACRAVGAEPIAVTSLGASMFGATDPDFTWLDMESELARRRLWPYRSVAASLGGGGDAGRGLSPEGRQLLLDAIERNHARLLDAPTVLDAVRARVALYDSLAGARGARIAAYVNVGGGIASLGGAQNGRLIPAGFTRRLAARNYPNRGVIIVMAERRVPIIHLLDVQHLAHVYGIVQRNQETVEPGRGLLFIRYRYNLWVVGAVTVIVLLANFVVLRLDLRQRLLARLRPERRVLL